MQGVERNQKSSEQARLELEWSTMDNRQSTCAGLLAGFLFLGLCAGVPVFEEREGGKRGSGGRRPIR